MYPYIYDFLLKCGHSRTAEALVKDAKLDTKKMKTLAKEKDLIGMFGASKKSANSSESAFKKSSAMYKKCEPSSSSGSDSDSDHKEMITKKQIPVAILKAVKPVVEKVARKPAPASSASSSDSSSSSSDDSDSEESTAKPAVKKVF
jgi:hypothetical protein